MSPDAKISRVLVGVEFDEASASALAFAGALAGAWEAEITVFHSAQLEVPAYFTGAQIVALEAERERGRAAIAARLRGFAEQHVGRAVHVAVEEGPPADTLLRMAASFDLIVVGTHRRHGARRWWLGSVAEAVVRSSSCPVLVVPAGAVVRAPRRPLTIRAAGSVTAEADAWVEALRLALRGNVVQSLDVRQCTPDRLEDTDLIVWSMAADSDTPSSFAAIAQVLEECVHPVLFVPSAGGVFERSSS
jgi:nucleotide-binding universal stress UspA family protein